MDVLPGNVNRWLRDKEAQVRREHRAKVKRGKTLTQLIQWCLDQDLPSDLCPANSLQLNEFYLTAELLNAIDQRQRLLGHHSFRDDLSDKTRMEQAQQSDQEDKQQGLKPRENRVLVYLPKPLPCELTGQIPVVDLDVTALDLSRFSRLITVENLDCFYRLADFCLSPQSDDLIVYRGDQLYARGVKKLRQAWQALYPDDKTHPMIYFGDFDPAGVKIAISEGYQQLLLPPDDQLEAHARPLMNPEKQDTSNHTLQTYRAQLNPALQTLLPTLKQRGLRQQKMQGLALRILNIYPDKAQDGSGC
ncbi:DUF7281 domain-containing protein [Oceanospirillum linum]|uniref:DUF7281 domain-containing protein n=1 Tax=Oceanospirillum linum TaxID=966 RepID=A0A1T1HBU2_OCELI|nr:hypothetical protein [Oceanospirillum linum]OOV87324.1 hypothetical protein BTA35_0210165 [Oceanospirillum linum]SEF81484.1 hypothetical protein SAMN04489856_102432 [Oleiphilus messinensis]SMP19110.1 hypothetical protein SAMN06264348_103433 [Oceanospirillum linum]